MTKQVDVTIIRCHDIPKGQLLGKQSPYIIAKHGSQEFRSKTAKDGDRDPQFNETFSFVVKEVEDTMVEFRIFSERKDALLGTVRADVILALQQGQMRKSFPVTSTEDKPQGMMEISVKCPLVLQAVQAARATEASRVNEAQQHYNDALVAARAKFYGVVSEQMGPHEAVTGALFDEHFEHVKAVQKEEEEEMGEVFKEPLKRGEELVKEAANGWSELTKELLKDIPETLEEQCKESKGRFSKQLQTLLSIISESDQRRLGELQAAEKGLIGGVNELLAQYRSRVMTACDRYEQTVKGGVHRYKGEVESEYRKEAEGKALSEAAALAPPPPVTHTAPHPPAPATPPAVTAPRSPVRVAAAPPARAPAAPVYPHHAPSAVPVGYPMTENERAEGERRRAEQDAREARVAADRAAMEAQQARQQAAASQEMLRRQIEEQRRAAAVRRGVVGGVLLSRALRR